MKKVLIAILTMLSLSLNYGQTTATLPSGSGTEVDPFQIATLDNLSWLVQTDSVWSANFIQTADIDASATATWDDSDENGDGDKYNDPADVTADSSNDGWSGIGIYSGVHFTGNYNGQGYTIDGVTINRSGAKYMGFFGATDSLASIKNLGLTNINYLCDSFTGGLVGTSFNHTFVMDNCYTTGSVTVDNGYVVGGLVGYLGKSGNGGTVSNSYSEVNVITNEIQYAGGLIGMVKGSMANITKCYTTGDVSGSHNASGTFIGECQTGVTVSESYSTGNLLAGKADRTNVGGFIGSIRGATVSNCYSNASISGAGAISGGFIGQSKDGVIEYCYSTGANNIDSKKGFIGFSDGTNTSNFLDVIASGCDDSWSNVAAERTTTEMQTDTTFTNAGWDLVNVWEMYGSYPNLRNNSNPNLEYKIPAPSGSGTEGDPYQIATLDNLSWLVQTEEAWGAYFIQTADIDASATATWDDSDENGDGDKYNDPADVTADSSNDGWSGIGVYSGVHFTGNYNGQGYTIDGVTINRSGAKHMGFFAVTDSLASIKNLGLTNINYLCDSFTGGLVGDAYNHTFVLDSCYTTGTVTVDDGYVVGGLVAYLGKSGNGGTVSNSYSEVNVITNEIQYAGGLIGMVKGSMANITRCYTTGDVSGSSNASGTFIGECQTDVTVSESYSTGNLLAGKADRTNVGGFIGSIRGATVSNCYSNASISGAGAISGGFIGQSKDGVIEYCYSTGANNIDSKKGFIGFSDGTNTSNFLDVTASGCDDSWSNVAAERTTAEMQTDTTFTNAGWDLVNVWEMVNSYPNLKNNSNPDLLKGEPGNSMIAPEGSGTKSDPYLIATLENLSWLTQSDSAWTKVYLQTADINASATALWDDSDDNGDGDLYNDENDNSLGGNNEGWKAIGMKDSTLFEGDYNGQGFVIDSLTINRPTGQNQGFFGVVLYSTIEKLGLTNIKFNADSYLGGLISYCDENYIDSCYVTGTMTVQGDISVWAAGGFAAYIGSNKVGTEITNSYSDVDLTCVKGTNLTGGFVGYAKGVCKIEKCYSLGDVHGAGTSSGPFGGKIVDSEVYECYSIGNITTMEGGSDAISAFCGDNYRSKFINCYSTGSLSGTAKTIEVGNKYDHSHGGFIGRNTSPSTTQNCYAIGTNGIYSDRGFVGNEADANGQPVYISNYLDTTASGCTQIKLGSLVPQTVAFEKTTEEMKLESTYTDWDFKNYWRIVENQYPTLRMGDIEVGIKDENINAIPSEYALQQNYPNPFNPSTTINFSLPKAGITELSIYNMLGQKVATLVSKELVAGSYSYTFDATDISSGVYFYKLTSNNYSKVSKMMLLK